MGVLGEDGGESQILIGSNNNPIWFGLISEARALFTDTFFYVYDQWRTFHAGLGLPCPTNEMDYGYLQVIRGFEEHWQRHFAPNNVIISYLEALLKRGR